MDSTDVCRCRSPSVFDFSSKSIAIIFALVGHPFPALTSFARCVRTHSHALREGYRKHNNNNEPRSSRLLREKPNGKLFLWLWPAYVVNVQLKVVGSIGDATIVTWFRSSQKARNESHHEKKTLLCFAPTPTTNFFNPVLQSRQALSLTSTLVVPGHVLLDSMVVNDDLLSLKLYPAVLFCMQNWEVFSRFVPCACYSFWTNKRVPPNLFLGVVTYYLVLIIPLQYDIMIYSSSSKTRVDSKVDIYYYS